MPTPDERPRFLSEVDCRDIMQRLTRFARGGGYTSVSIVSTWTGNIRWARNQVSTSGEVRDNMIGVERNINGAHAELLMNDTTDVALMAAVRRVERLLGVERERPNSDLIARLPLESCSTPSLFSDATYQLDAEQRAAAAVTLTKEAQAAGMLAAGYIEVVAACVAILDTLGRVRYFPYTQAQYSVTVRDPQGTGSGWAGVDWYDWGKIDAPALTHQALDKCLRSRNPVAIEPGRYTTILEPQAVSDLVGRLFGGPLDAANAPVDRGKNEYEAGPFLKSLPNPSTGAPGYSRLGEKVVDERITISADPMDPELGFPPFLAMGSFAGDPFVTAVFHPATWIDHGVLTNLAYDREYGIRLLQRNPGLPNSGAFRMSGGDTSIDEMIATTKRGVLVTRFDDVIQIEFTSQLYRGFTRDGLWLIENGKISKPVKNLVFTESILFALNNVEQLGPPQRVFNPNMALLFGGIPQPRVVPPLKVRDFSFTALSDAV